MQIFLQKNMFFNIKKLPDLYLRARINNVRARGRRETPLWVLVHEFSKKKERLSDENLSFFVAKLGLSFGLCLIDDYRVAILSSRTSSLSPQITNLRGPL